MEFRGCLRDRCANFVLENPDLPGHVKLTLASIGADEHLLRGLLSELLRRRSLVEPSAVPPPPLLLRIPDSPEGLDPDRSHRPDELLSLAGERKV